MTKPADLPNDIETLKVLLVASEDRNLSKQDRVDQLEKLIAYFMRALFGAWSEKADPEQFVLSLEDIETALLVMQVSPASNGLRRSRLKTKRVIRLHPARQSRAIPAVPHFPSIYRALKSLLSPIGRSAAVAVRFMLVARVSKHAAPSSLRRSSSLSCASPNMPVAPALMILCKRLHQHV